MSTIYLMGWYFKKIYRNTSVVRGMKVWKTFKFSSDLGQQLAITRFKKKSLIGDFHIGF